MWTEHFRPATLNDIVGHVEHISMLKEKIKQIVENDTSIKGLRIMLYGPPGTGKTSTVQALINDLKLTRTFQKNASDDRTLTGMSDVRDFIISNPEKSILFLDECDNLTSDAQDSLKRIIDSKAADDVHIILCVNDLSGVSEELQDRLVILQFKHVDTPSHVAFLRGVLTKSGITKPVSVQTLTTIIKSAFGDIRQSINELCACYILSVSRFNDEIEARHKSILSVILNSFWLSIPEDRQKLLDRATEQGYTCADIINLLSKTICECDTAKEEDIQTIFLSLKAIKAGCVDKIHMLTLC